MERDYKRDIRKLNPRHLKIQDLALEGLKIKDIAEQLHMHRPHVSMIINSASFQHELSIRRSSVAEQVENNVASLDDEVASALKRSAKQAVDKIVDKMAHAEDEKLQVKSAIEILDRSGYPKSTRVEGQQVNIAIGISDDSAQLIADTMELDKD